MNGNGVESGWMIIESFGGEIILVEPNGKIERGFDHLDKAVATLQARGGRIGTVYLYGPETVAERRGINHDCYPKRDA